MGLVHMFLLRIKWMRNRAINVDYKQLSVRIKVIAFFALHLIYS